MQFTVTEKQLIEGLEDVITSLDSDTLASLASDLIGGQIVYDVNNDVYVVTPNEEYLGGLDPHNN